MREIKFRAWDKKNKKMLHWDKEPYLDFFIGDYGALLREAFDEMIINQGLVLMQFTGLLDKNGKEIYESDRIKHDLWGEFNIEWDEMSAGFRAVSDDKESDLNLAHAQLQRCRIIGNKYEN